MAKALKDGRAIKVIDLDYCPVEAPIVADRLRTYAERNGIAVVEDARMPEAWEGWSNPNRGIIALRAGMPPVQTMRVLIHELVHVLDESSHQAEHNGPSEAAPQTADWILSAVTGNGRPDDVAMREGQYFAWKGVAENAGRSGTIAICQLYKAICEQGAS